MIIPELTVGEVVAEASKRMSDPNFSAVLVGGFVQGQKAATHYLTAHADEIGGAEAVVNLIFHAALIGQVFQRGYGRGVRAIEFDDLDTVSEGDRMAKLREQQPHVVAYIEANVEHARMREIVTLVALAMEWVS